MLSKRRPQTRSNLEPTISAQKGLHVQLSHYYAQTLGEDQEINAQFLFRRER